MLSRERLEEIVSSGHEASMAGADEVSEMARDLLALRWRLITETDLPKVGDEVGGNYFPNLKLPSTGWHVCDYTQMMQPVSFGEYERLGWTHFRPKSPPARTDKGE